MKHMGGMKHLNFGIVLFLIFSAGAVHAEKIRPTDVSMKIETVALFKNGLGFFTSTATLPENEKTVRFGQLPIPSFGSFWVGYAKDVKVRSLITSMEDWQEKIPLQNLGQILQINAGRRVTLRTGSGDKDILEGVVLPQVMDAGVSEPPNPYFMDSGRRQNLNDRYLVRSSCRQCAAD